MCFDVVDGFLRNAIQGEFYFTGETAFLPCFLEIHSQLIILANFTSQHFESCDQSQVLQIDWPQSTRKTEQVFDSLLRESFQFLKRLPPTLILDGLLSQLDTLFQSNHRLDRVIMQLTRQA